MFTIPEVLVCSEGAEKEGQMFLRSLGAIILVGTIATLTIPTVAAVPVDYEFERTWRRTDRPVSESRVSRTWMWGPEAFTNSGYEPYAESPEGRREVQYFDKSRMEITNPSADRDATWYVTNGLLARELITGNRQFGDTSFQQYQPAQVNVAGDPNDPNGPTYATFNGLKGYQPVPTGWSITQTVNREGQVGSDDSLASYGVTAAHNVNVPGLNHSVASVFWDFMNSSGLVYEGFQYVTAPLFENPFYATGYPLTEAYWTTVLVGGTPKLVLSQVFERRVLTYTPDNPDGWKVEAGNVGQHYYHWRYVDAPTRGDRFNPIPIHTPAALGDGWTMKVENVIPDATTVVMDENMFNDPPEPGKQFFIAKVTATYTGPGSDRFDGDYRLRAVGAANVSYSTFSDSCGVIPDEISFAEVFSGGSITGNVCWQITASDAASLVMYDDPSGFDAPMRLYFALR